MHSRLFAPLPMRAIVRRTFAMETEPRSSCRTSKAKWLLAASLAISLLPVKAPAQSDITSLVIGRGYRQEMLVCDSRSQLDQAVGLLRAGQHSIGQCNWRVTEFVPRARVPETFVRLPATWTHPSGRVERIYIPGEFMLAWQYNHRPNSVFIFYPTEQMRLVHPRGQ